MYTLEELPILEHYNNLLQKSDKQSAFKIIEEYFRIFKEKDTPDVLGFLLAAFLRADNGEIEAQQRGNMIFFYKHLIIFMDASYFLFNERNINKKKKKKESG